MIKTNQGIVSEQWIRNDDGVLAVSGEDKKIAWKGYHEFAWDGKTLSLADANSIVPHLLDKT